MNNDLKSIFKEEITNFLDYKRNNGFLYESQYWHLRELDNFLYSKDLKEKKLKKEDILEFINKNQNAKSRTKAGYASIFRNFANYLQLNDIEAYVIPDNYFRSEYNFKPYIYSTDEIKRIINAIEKCYLKKIPKKQAQVKIIVLLLFKTGMRIGEILNIKRSNIDYEKNTIVIEETKNGSDRMISISENMINTLKDFDSKYNDQYEYFFENNYQSKYSVGCFNSIFKKLLYKAKIMHTENGPRVHDARHTFCVNSLKQALSKGMDINAYMPILSTYVGHKDLDSTYKYLHLTFELFPDIRKKVEKIIEERQIDYEQF